MSQPQSSSGPLSPDDALPPIEPPSAGFLVQLFLIPGIIVTIIVVVWLLFHWLAQMGNDPRDYVRKLRGNNEVRWQAAVNLAGALHGAAGDEIRRDSTLAADLAQILKEEIDSATNDDSSIKMRTYLCRAIGEFKSEAPLPALLLALKTQNSDSDIPVRCAAVEGLASLVANLKSEQPTWSNPELTTALLAASKSDDDSLTNFRAEAAFALGMLDDPQVTARLQAMLDDPNPDARFNAATALARHGDVAALPVLLEMIDPDQSLATKEEHPENRVEKQKLVNINGLRALVQLANANPTFDLTKAQAAVDQLTKSKQPEVRDNAMAVRDKLSKMKKSDLPTAEQPPTNSSK